MSNMYSRMHGDFAKDPISKQRCAERLLRIRKSLSPLHDRKCDSTLLLGTWNIRDFNSNKFGYGYRLPESFYYLAEMISCFDLVALQEINRDLSGLEKLMSILGREWDYIATDTTSGKGGNDERTAFVYNKEKVWFRKIAGEIVLPEGQLIVPPGEANPEADKKTDALIKKSKDVAPAEGKGLQFARSPFLVAFQSGWFRFSLCTAHLYYGAASGPALQRRIAEIEKLVEFFAERQDVASRQEKDRSGAVENYIILGDFNVVSPEHKTMQALKSNGFVVPEAIDGKKVRKLGDHFYDQIAVRVKDPRFKVLGGGLLRMFDEVFTDADEAIYAPLMPKKDPEKDPAWTAKDQAALYKKWRTWQMSDHHPLWIEIATDFSDDYLGTIAGAAPGG